MSVVVAAPAPPATAAGQVLNTAANIVANNIMRLTGTVAAVTAPNAAANNMQANLNASYTAARNTINNAAARVSQSGSHAVNSTDAAVMAQLTRNAEAKYNLASDQIAELRASGSLAAAQQAEESYQDAQASLTDLENAANEISSGGRASYSDSEDFDDDYVDTAARRYRRKKYIESGKSRSVTKVPKRSRTKSPTPSKPKPRRARSPAPTSTTRAKRGPAAAAGRGRSRRQEEATITIHGTPTKRGVPKKRNYAK